MRDDVTEERIGCCRFGIGVCIKSVTGELGEVINVGLGHLAWTADDGVAEPQLGQVLAERVYIAGDTSRPGNPFVSHCGEDVRCSLDCSALHVVQHSAQTTELFAASRAAGSTVH